MTEQFTFFWNGPFSQWHTSPFIIEGKTYMTAEQYMMYCKAMFFDDVDVALQIMETENPREQKALGRKVSSFDADSWSNVAQAIVKEGTRAKFSQNPDLLEKLVATVGTTLVEASPYDKIWGIGLRETDLKCLDRSTWRGTNWLGEILTEVRIELCGG